MVGDIIFSVLAFIALCVSICIRDRKRSLTVQSLNCIFEGIYCFVINAYTGAFLSFINFFRTIIFINKNKFSKLKYLIILLIFETIVIVNCIYTWVGIISLLPTIGTIIRTYCLWQSKMKYVRISGITTAVLYGSYYIYYNSWFMVLGDLMLLIISIISLYKNDIKKHFNIIDLN